MARKVLYGANVAELPAERPTRFQLVANLRTAKLLGNLQGPMRSRSEDIAAATKTYQLVGESIARSDARFEGEVQASFVQSLRQAFSKSEEELWAFLRQVGIDPRLLAASVIEESLASNMLFYGAETRVTNVNDMVWCCFPFCFRRPT